MLFRLPPPAAVVTENRCGASVSVSPGRWRHQRLQTDQRPRNPSDAVETFCPRSSSACLHTRPQPGRLRRRSARADGRHANGPGPTRLHARFELPNQCGGRFGRRDIEGRNRIVPQADRQRPGPVDGRVGRTDEIEAGSVKPERIAPGPFGPRIGDDDTAIAARLHTIEREACPTQVAAWLNFRGGGAARKHDRAGRTAFDRYAVSIQRHGVDLRTLRV